MLASFPPLKRRALKAGAFCVSSRTGGMDQTGNVDALISFTQVHGISPSEFVRRHGGPSQRKGRV